MRDQPDGAKLLEIARAEFQRDILPALPPEMKYKGLMIANAMAIAARQFYDNGEMPTDKTEQLNDLLGQVPGDPQAAFCELIRQGAFDPGTPNHQRMFDTLTMMALSRLAESNPKFLKEHADTLKNGATTE